MKVISRERWGAVGTVPRDGVPKHELAVHHTVTQPGLTTAARERAHMRELEQFHLARGFSTIGYSWVVFPSGRIYEGRGKRGLPAGQEGQNSGTWAVAFALNGDLKRPSLLARRTVRRLIRSLKADDGLTRLGGHQEFPSQATACPGAKVMPFVRKWRGDFNLLRPFA